LQAIAANDVEKMKNFVELIVDLIPGGATFVLTNQTEDNLEMHIKNI